MADAGKTRAPNWAVDLGAEATDAPTSNLPETQRIKLGDNATFLFTSGTTGLPKAAVVSHRRFLSTGLTDVAPRPQEQRERSSVHLPAAVSRHRTDGRILFGVVVRLVDVRAAQILGLELPEGDARVRHDLLRLHRRAVPLSREPAREAGRCRQSRCERIVGNGLRPDIWLDFKKRYGIKRITEFYGASEGNVAFMNLLNKDRTIGMTASTIALVRYDVDADEIIRDSTGRCVPVAEGEPGLLLAEINETQVFEGYTNAEATQKKIVHGVLQDGDAWFNSGDLIRQVNVGFTVGQKHYQFVDRVGDTFRWRSENVSTNEVGEIINQHPQVQFCNVYGVSIPNADGRAGMAAITLKSGLKQLDVADFSAYVARELPSYARPVFVRIQPEMEVTGTFKLMKGDLRREGYDLATVNEPLYVMKPGQPTYEPLDQQFLSRIRAGMAGY